MKVDTEKETVDYEEYDPVALKKSIENHHKGIDFQKKNKQKEPFSVSIVVDDFADDPKFKKRYRNIPPGLFARGRHSAISCVLSTHKRMSRHLLYDSIAVRCLYSDLRI